VVLAAVAQHGDALEYASVALQRQGPALRAEVARRAENAAAATANSASADAEAAATTTAAAAEPAVVLERVRTAADVEAVARARVIELEDTTAGPEEQPAAKRRRVEPAALTALPTPKPADQEELEQLRAQLAEQRPSMIYELQVRKTPSWSRSWANFSL
jgi:hypothetical protein